MIGTYTDYTGLRLRPEQQVFRVSEGDDGQTYRIVALWIDRNTRTDVSLLGEDGQMHRADSADLFIIPACPEEELWH